MYHFSPLQFSEAEQVNQAGEYGKCLHVYWTETTAFKPLNSWQVVNFLSNLLEIDMEKDMGSAGVLLPIT